LIAGGLAGLGAGLLLGHTAGSPAVTYVGAALLVVGLVTAIAVSRGAEPDPAPPPPHLDGLGDRVQQILRLAEEQAEDNRAEARRVLDEARAQARRIVDDADRRPTG
jgi:hypothetical protein